MTALRRHMREDLQLRGLAPKTQQCSLEAVEHRRHYYRRAPERWQTSSGPMLPPIRSGCGRGFPAQSSPCDG